MATVSEAFGIERPFTEEDARKVQKDTHEAALLIDQYLPGPENEKKRFEIKRVLARTDGRMGGLLDDYQAAKDKAKSESVGKPDDSGPNQTKPDPVLGSDCLK